MLEWTLSAFAAHPAISWIVLVAGADERERVAASAAGIPRIHSVMTGGATRADSVRRGLEAVPPEAELVLVHDAARPLVSGAVIDRVLETTARLGAAVPGLPLADTVKRVDRSGLIRRTVPRTAVLDGRDLADLMTVQTPQGARVEWLRAAYAAYDARSPMLSEAAEPTDEASLLELAGFPVAVAPGDPANMKITRPEDLILAEHLLHPAETRTGFGYDVHAFAEPESRRKLFLGGVEIPHDRGLAGHSDADVLLHALCDALLGAASLGDIGILFPNTDPAYLGISSLRLLAAVRDRVRSAGWRIVHLDACVAAEAPRLVPYREAMQLAIADCLQIAPSCVSLKATTSEKMGFVGRQEGVACWAVATVRTLQNDY